jgi:hypothetical protein
LSEKKFVQGFATVKQKRWIPRRSFIGRLVSTPVCIASLGSLLRELPLFDMLETRGYVCDNRGLIIREMKDLGL